MNDIRYRLGAAAVLSVAAFISMTGAIAVIIWSVVYSLRSGSGIRYAVLLGSGAMVAVISGMLQALYGTGISYGIRMCAVLLVAAWVWSEYRPGEFLRFGAWLGTGRHGFDLGLVAELSLQALDSFLLDLSRLKTAWAIKGSALDAGNILVAGSILVNGALARAQETAAILAARGYRGGGMLCPSFTPARSDLAGLFLAVCALALALIPVGEFFILPK